VAVVAGFVYAAASDEFTKPFTGTGEVFTVGFMRDEFVP